LAVQFGIGEEGDSASLKNLLQNVLQGSMCEIILREKASRVDIEKRVLFFGGRKTSFLYIVDTCIISLNSHAWNRDKRGGSKESSHDHVVEIYDQLSKNNFEMLDII
jgi:hypothetical protein